jgi:hypothetical protein
MRGVFGYEPAGEPMSNRAIKVTLRSAREVSSLSDPSMLHSRDGMQHAGQGKTGTVIVILTRKQEKSRHLSIYQTRASPCL